MRASGAMLGFRLLPRHVGHCPLLVRPTLPPMVGCLFVDPQPSPCPSPAAVRDHIVAINVTPAISSLDWDSLVQLIVDQIVIKYFYSSINIYINKTCCIQQRLLLFVWPLVGAFFPPSLGCMARPEESLCWSKSITENLELPSPQCPNKASPSVVPNQRYPKHT